jgi:hypothetical protein
MAVDTEDLKAQPQSAKEAKAAAKAAKVHAKAMRPWYKKKRFILLALIILGIGAAASGGSKSKSSNTSNNASAATKAPAGVKSVDTNASHPAAGDVEVTKCAEGQFGLAEVAVTITNHTSKRSNYSVQMNLTDAAGNKVGEGIAASNNVEAGQSALEKVAATNSAPFTKCEIKEVSRFAA